MSRHAAPPSAPSPSPAPDRHRGGRGRLAELRGDPLLALAVSASLGAGLVHVAVAPEHRAWWASVAFFVSLGLFQLGWAALLLLREPPRRVLYLGALVNAGALVTWAVSRTTGMPFGPHQGEAEPMARADALASLLGTAVIVAALGVARGWAPAARLKQLRPVAASSAGAVLVCAMSIVALTGVSGHAHPAGGNHAEHGGDVPGGLLPAAVSSPLAPSEVAAAAVRCAKQAEIAATLAQRAKDKPGAKATSAVRKQEQRLRLACEPGAAAVGPAAARTEGPAVPHDDSDGHSH